MERSNRTVSTIYTQKFSGSLQNKTKQLLELSEFRKVAGYKVNKQQQKTNIKINGISVCSQLTIKKLKNIPLTCLLYAWHCSKYYANTNSFNPQTNKQTKTTPL